MPDDQSSTTESLAGRAKEAVGSALGADSVRDEGRAQQNKAEAQDQVEQKKEELREAKAQESAEKAEENKNKPS